MIRLVELLSQTRTSLLSNGCFNSSWRGRSVQNILKSQSSSFSGDFEKDIEKKIPSHSPLPEEPSNGPPDYLKRGGPIELSMRPDFSKCDDPRTEEERDKDAEILFKRLSDKGLLLTAEQAAKIYPNSPYFKKEKDRTSLSN